VIIRVYCCFLKSTRLHHIQHTEKNRTASRKKKLLKCFCYIHSSTYKTAYKERKGTITTTTTTTTHIIKIKEEKKNTQQSKLHIHS